MERHARRLEARDTCAIVEKLSWAMWNWLASLFSPVQVRASLYLSLIHFAHRETLGITVAEI